MEQGRSFSGHERNCCFLNVAGERFANVSAVSGLDYPDDGRSIAEGFGLPGDHLGDRAEHGARDIANPRRGQRPSLRVIFCFVPIRGLTISVMWQDSRGFVVLD